MGLHNERHFVLFMYVLIQSFATVANMFVGHTSLLELFSSPSSDTLTPLTHSDCVMWCVLPPGLSLAATDTRRCSAMGSHHAPNLFHDFLLTLCRNLYRSPDHVALALVGNCTR